MEIQVMKIHVDHAIVDFQDKWKDLFLEEDRTLVNIQDCQECLHAMNQTQRTLSLALQKEIRERI